jgi:hypothetical protein
MAITSSKLLARVQERCRTHADGMEIFIITAKLIGNGISGLSG